MALSPPAATQPVTARRRGLGQLLRGASWNLLAQVVFVLSNVLATPFLLHHLGPDRYGLVGLTLSFIVVFSTLDGGVSNAALAYFSRHVGAGDRDALSRLLVTLQLMLLGLAVLVSVVVVVLAPQIALLVHASPPLRSEAVVLLRSCVPAVGLVTIRTLLLALLNAHNDWWQSALVNVTSVVAYLATAVVLVDRGHGIAGVIVAIYVQNVGATVLAAGFAIRRVHLRDRVLMSWADTRAFLAYAWRLQVSGLASLINYEFDALLIGALFPVRYLGYYAIGAGVALQLAVLPTNATTPITTRLGQRFGSAGYEATVAMFRDVRRNWLALTFGFAAVGAATAGIGVDLWLGPPAGPVAGGFTVILLLGWSCGVVLNVLMALMRILGRPGFESRYGVICVLAKALLTAPLALLLGPLGVASATALGLLVGATYFVLATGRSLGQPSLGRLPGRVIIAGLAAAGGAFGLDQALRVSGVAHGVLGMLACAVPAGLALGAYLLVGLGVPLPSRGSVRSWLASRPAPSG